MDESDRFDSKAISNVLEEAAEFQKKYLLLVSCNPSTILTTSFRWESAQYYIGQFHDDCYKALSDGDKISRYASEDFVEFLTDGWITED